MASTGADVIGPSIEYAADGLAASISIEVALPGGGIPQISELRFKERWERPYRDQRWRLTEYAYELLDHERGLRTALHLHHQDWFVVNFHVVVHEHCESPIGSSACEHYAGVPVSDGSEALDRLMSVWLDDVVPDCSRLTCLE